MNDWNDAEQRVERAAEFFAQRRWHDAIKELRAAISINPHNPAWLFNLGLTLDEMGSYSEGVTAYQQALELMPDDLETLNHLGIDQHRIGRFDHALRTFERMEKIDPKYEPGYCNRIITYTDLNDHEKAEEMFYLARIYREHCPHCYYHIGISLAKRGIHNKAIYCWQKTLDLQEGHHEVHLRMAESYRALGDLETARQQYLSGLRQDPGNTDALLDLGDLLMQMDRGDEAGEKYRRAVETDPQSPACHYRYGLWLLKQHRLDEALRAFAKTLRLDPTFAGAHLRLGEIHHQKRNRPAARKELRAEMLLSPTDPAMLLHLSNLLIDTGQCQAAQICLRRLTQLEPGHVRGWQNLAVALFLRRQYAEGIRSCLAVLELDPNHLETIYNLALAHEKIGRYADALTWVQRGLQLNLKDASFQKLEFRLRVFRLRSGVVRAIRRLICLG